MNQILNIKGTEINLSSFDLQTGTIGKPFRQFGLIVNTEFPEKWVNKVLKKHWIYLFKYEDGNIFGIEIDYNGNFFKKLTHKDCIYKINV